MRCGGLGRVATLAKYPISGFGTPSDAGTDDGWHCEWISGRHAPGPASLRHPQTCNQVGERAAVEQPDRCRGSASRVAVHNLLTSSICSQECFAPPHGPAPCPPSSLPAPSLRACLHRCVCCQRLHEDVRCGLREPHLPLSFLPTGPGVRGGAWPRHRRASQCCPHSHLCA